MSEIGLRLALKHDRKRQRLGGDRCENCGNKDIRVLQESIIQSKRMVLCAECRLCLQGKSIYEAHHIIGRDNDDFTILLPANDHAVLTEENMEQEDFTPSERLYKWLQALKIILNQVLKLIDEELARYGKQVRQKRYYRRKDINRKRNL